VRVSDRRLHRAYVQPRCPGWRIRGRKARAGASSSGGCGQQLTVAAGRGPCADSCCTCARTPDVAGRGARSATAGTPRANADAGFRHGCSPACVSRNGSPSPCGRCSFSCFGGGAAGCCGGGAI
jgi:hypothetical protein